MFRRPIDGIVHAPRSRMSSAIQRQLLNRIEAVLALAVITIGISFCDLPPAWSQQIQAFKREPTLKYEFSTFQRDPALVQHIQVVRYKSRTVGLNAQFASAVVGNPEIADVLPMSEREIYIQGKKVGTTNVSIFDKDKNPIGVLDLDVTIDVQNIRDKIRSGTESRGITVSSANDQIVLSGEARNSVDAERAVAIAKAMVTGPDGKAPDNPEKYVVNAMRVAASQQVLLRVRFIEVNRNAERDIGINWFGGSKGGTRGFNTGRFTPAALSPATQGGRFLQPTTPTNPPTTPTPGFPPPSDQGGIPLFQTLATFASGTLSAPFGVGLFNIVNKTVNGASIDLLISALETKGLARRLAEPDLIALSGDTASFLAGGEYPVPSVQSSSGTVPVITTQYYPFGVQLTFIPTVLANGVINLRLTPSVSELDYRNAVSIGGTLVPSLSKREARTVIELRDGQSFAIAGLLQSDNIRDISQVPWIGSVPVLGTLFRSTSYSQNETDLVVIVTPHLVAPAAPGQALATPFDKTLPGNDFDLFLMGREEVRKQFTEYVTSRGELQGPYGHMMPLDPK
jgi:pilus assembly protein CpaC